MTEQLPLRKNYTLSDAAFVFTLAVILNGIMSFVVLAIAGGDAEKLESDPTYSFIGTALIQLGLLALWAGYSLLNRINLTAAPRIGCAAPAYFRQAAALTLAAFGVGIALEYLLIWFFGIINYEPAQLPYRGAIDLLILIPVFCILPAVCEELIFRGVILQGLRSRLGNKTAVVVSAVLFALIHMNIAQTLYQFVLGLALGFLTVRSGKLLPAIMMHFLSNSLALVRLAVFEAGAPAMAVDGIFGAVAALALGWLTVELLAKKPVVGSDAPDENGDTDKTAAIPTTALFVLAIGAACCMFVWIADLLQRT